MYLQTVYHVNMHVYVLKKQHFILKLNSYSTEFGHMQIKEKELSNMTD